MNESWQQEARRLGAATPTELRQRLDMLRRSQPEQLTALHQALAQRDALIAEMKHYLQRNNQELQRLYQLLEPSEVPDTIQ
jgi:hypothetical protein